jgi:dTDP-4-dehydrorhamnose reductase
MVGSPNMLPVSRQRVLVTGANGRLGRFLWSNLDGRTEAWGTGRQNAPDVERYKQCDLIVASAVERMFEELRPHSCIHCAAISDPDICEQEPELCRAMNVLATENICTASRCYSVRLVFVSSDYVFGNDKHVYREDDAASPLLMYGETKLAAEHIVKQLAGSAILRVPLLYGSFDTCFVGATWRVLAQGVEAAFDDQTLRYPVFIADLLQVFSRLVASPSIAGLLHASGHEAITKFEWAAMIARLCGFDAGRLRRVRQSNSGSGAVRPGTRRLDDSKLRALMGYEPRSVLAGTQSTLAGLGRKRS